MIFAIGAEDSTTEGTALSQRPLFDDVKPKPLPPLEDDEPAPACPMCGTMLDGKSRCAKCDPERP